jgi:hypothetical protein
MQHDRLLCRLRAAALAIIMLGAASSGFAQYSSPIHDVDNPARQPLKAGTGVQFALGQTQASANVVTVPANKRLVLEYFTMACQASLASMALSESSPSSLIATLDMSAGMHLPFGPTGFTVWSSLLHYTVDAGNTLSLLATNSKPTVSYLCNGYVIGHYVNLP